MHDASKVVDRNTTRLHTVHILPDPARPGEFMSPFMGAIEFADSNDHPQLQVADWAAGATRQWAQWMAGGSGDQFSRDLEQVVRPWLIDLIWPAPVESPES